MRELHLHQDAKRTVNNAIFITGPGRTGSTLLGRIFQSYKDIEYAYEPDFLYVLFSMISEMPENQFRLLFETFMYEGVFLNQVTGRSWNFNENDESCIYRARSREEVAERLKVAWTKASSIEAGRKNQFVFKLTDSAQHCHQLIDYYPSMRVVITHRSANACIQSLLKKGWFSDRILGQRNIVWLSQTETGIVTPPWVPATKAAAWAEWPEVERAGYYYFRMLEQAKGLKNTYVFSYDELVQDPATAIGNLARHHGLQFGGLTQDIIRSVHEPRRLDDNWTAKLTSSLREKVECLSDVRYYRKFVAMK